ncbi:MAG: single-stranded-DNA-specific exonuclease RecJ [Lachnospiraceae bacterium]|nr:single-stranded-DNA-specific exonuclease RecJ [Lachnospiraceae bacterium]
MRSKWIEYTKKADFRMWSEELHISVLTARLLRNRNVETLEEAKQYLYGTIDDLQDPALLKDLETAVRLLAGVREKQGRVCVVSDYDDDGIFAGRILQEGLDTLGIANEVLSPNRNHEGYGINRRIIDDAKAHGCSLILTCDNGIAAYDEIVYAKECGLQVIITDHHEPQYEDLPADAVIDAKQPDCPYPFKELCGAGVAFRLIQALYRKFGIPKEKEEELYEYAAIATIADVVPLQGENRILVKEGLKRLRQTAKPGLKALIDVSGLVPEKLSSYHIGFVIGPCFNAVSRLTGEADLSRELLAARTYEEALPLAQKMRELNEMRKTMTEEGFREALAVIEGAAWKDDPLYVVPLKNTNEAVIGIIAGRLKERFYKPVIVLTPGEEPGVYKGSGRSIEAYHMMEHLTLCRDLLLRFGGHAMAAGLSIASDRIDAFRDALVKNCKLTEKDLTPVTHIDARVPLSFISEQMIRELSVLEPFGTANDKPLFALPHLKVCGVMVLGKNRNVLKLRIADESGRQIEAVDFQDGPELLQFLQTEFGEEAIEKARVGRENPIDLALAFYPDINEFRGSVTLQLVIQDWCRIR